MKIFLSQKNPIIGDLQGNFEKILQAIEEARKQKAQIVLFSELILCGYPPEDFLLYDDFIEEMDKILKKIAKHTQGLFVVLGLARKNPKIKEKGLFNSAAVIHDGKILGYKDKTLLPTYDVFDERRYFEPGEKQKVFELEGKRVGVLICEDAWEHSGKIEHTKYSRDPVEELKELKPHFVLVLSASPYYYQKKYLRQEVFCKAARSLNCPMIVCNQVGGNDQLVFDGYSLSISERGDILQQAKGFEEDCLLVDLHENAPCCFPQTEDLEDLFQALVLGVRDYFSKQGFKKACLGLSGGIDSALTAVIATKALGKENVLAFSLPSRYSSLSSLEDANLLSTILGIRLEQISIDHLFQVFLDVLSPFFGGKPFDTTEENLQARIRSMILMAFANKLGYIVLSTGNKSEMAMGYCTLYGDLSGGLGVLVDVSKKQVYELVHWINSKEKIIPDSIVTKIPSAELRNNQKDTDSLPEYDIIDRVLRDYVEESFSVEKIVQREKLSKPLVEDLVRRIHRAEYKRRQGPVGIRVTKRSFTKGRFFPIVQKWVY